MLIPHGTLVLVVDGGGLRLLRNCGTDTAPKLSLIEQQALHNPPSRAFDGGAPGRVFESAGSVRHAYPAADLHQRREDEFAETAYARLRTLGDATAIIIAPPRMLGKLRDLYSREFRHGLVGDIDKDLTHHNAADIANFLRHYRE